MIGLLFYFFHGHNKGLHSPCRRSATRAERVHVCGRDVKEPGVTTQLPR